MKLRDLIATVRDCPRLCEELAEAKTALETSRAECGKLEERCEVLNAAGLEKQYDLNRLQKENRGAAGSPDGPLSRTGLQREVAAIV